MARRKENGLAPESMSFEQAVEELESIIERIEQGQIGLEESLAQRRRGDALIKRCRGVLDAAEQELAQITAQERAQEGETGDAGGKKERGKVTGG